MEQQQPHPLKVFLEQHQEFDRAKLAQALGISRPYLSQLITRKRQPSLKIAVRIESVTEIPVEELL